jgi:hypothetical protein
MRILAKGCVAKPEPRAEDPKLNCLPEPGPKLRIDSSSGSFQFTSGLKKFFRKKIMLAEEVFVIIWYYFNPNTFSQQKKFSRYFIKLSGAGTGVGADKFGFAAPWCRS